MVLLPNKERGAEEEKFKKQIYVASMQNISRRCCQNLTGCGGEMVHKLPKMVNIEVGIQLV
jgi:hypothetical protein